MNRTRKYFCALLCLLFACTLAACLEIDEPTLEGSPTGDEQGRPEAPPPGIQVKQQAIARMQQAIQRYEQIADRGGWVTIPEVDSLSVGDTSGVVASLRERLMATGDLPESAAEADSGVYTQQLAQAVSRFQARHGLKPDSVLGPNTVAALNVPAGERLEQLRANLERLHELPDSLGHRFVLVNIPEFKLRTYEADKAVQEMAAIVGEEYEDQQTPRFSDKMEFIIFRPYWNVPDRIAEEELVPEERQDPGYLEENGFQIVSNWGPDANTFEVTPANLEKVEAGTLKLRQEPGSENALGLVKFMFPNQDAIYLHGTPADYLFGEQTRAFSHGCIRVEKPVDLAAFALQDKPEWTRAKIEQAMQEGERQQVNLGQTIPVHIVYLTAYVDTNGNARFFEDIYGLMGDTPAVASVGQEDSAETDEANASPQAR